MARYNVRDLLGHWVKPRSKRDKMCPHACCRNKRVHPANYPVILPSPLLRKASDDDLAAHFVKVSSGHTPGDRKAEAQILHEMERRDAMEIRRKDRQTESKRLLFAKRIEKAEEVDRRWLEAENATRGYMLNKAGKRADIDERSLFTGPESRARRYASEELLNHWQSHPRPTAAYFQGKDTTLGAQYTAPRRKQYGVGRRRAA
ncbi:MAG TPA: hypothetical protein VMV92_07770 [Streptosporangiaceae bacterium]|nr:hypothetical protein [Streptosporangiaceae bacterium]